MSSATVAPPAAVDSLADVQTESAATVPMMSWGKALGLLTLLCAALLMWNIWGVPLFDVDEPRYAQAAREMLQRGDWVTPYFNWELRFDKPPLHYWLIATVYQVFGVSVAAARSISCLSATLITLSLYAVCRRFGADNDQDGHTLGWWSAVIFATCLEVIAIGRMSITDMTLSLWMTLTTLSLWLVVRHNPKWWLAAGLFSGLGLLTKGPVALVLPGGILVVDALLTRQLKPALLTPYFPLALIIAALPYAAWFMAAWQANGNVFLDATYNHNFSRFSGAVEYHVEPWWYFIPVLLVGSLPWTPLLLANVKRSINAITKPLQANPALLFGVVWTVCVFGFFTIAKTKLLTYVLPMFPGLALWLGALIATSPAASLRKQLRTSFGSLFVVILAATPVILFQLSHWLPPEAAHLTVGPGNAVLLGLLLVTLGGAAVAAHQGKLTTSLNTAVVGIAVITVVAIITLVPKINTLTQGDITRFVDKANDAPLASYEITRPSLTWLTNRPIPALKREETALLHHFVASGPVTYLITKNKLAGDLESQLPKTVHASVADRGAVYRLYRITPTH